jgi:hypothetical protein
VNNEEYLNLIPERLCKYEENEGVTTVLFFKKPTFIEKMFFRKLIDKPHKIDLDEIGSFIWGKINSQNTIQEIISLTVDKFGEKVEPAENRVIQFIKQMHSTKLIMLYQKK